MPASSNYLLSKGKNAASAVTKKRFVKLVADDTDSVEQCDSAGENAYGVAVHSVSSAEIDKGKLVTCQTDGRAIVEAGSALTAGMNIATDNAGKAVEAAAGDYVLGMCDEPAGADTDECSVDLTKRSGVLAA